MRGRALLAVAVALVVLAVALTRLGVSQYYYFAAYVIFQYVVLATAWNILGGYTGYVNFGSAAFFALGAYTAAILIKTSPVPFPVLLLAAGTVGGLLGLSLGYLTFRLRGVFFSIATLALAVVLQTLIVNWEQIIEARGVRPYPKRRGARGRRSA